MGLIIVGIGAVGAGKGQLSADAGGTFPQGVTQDEFAGGHLVTLATLGEHMAVIKFIA